MTANSRVAHSVFLIPREGMARSIGPEIGNRVGAEGFPTVIDWGLVGSTGVGYHEIKRCSRDTYPESYITRYTSKQRYKKQDAG